MHRFRAPCCKLVYRVRSVATTPAANQLFHWFNNMTLLKAAPLSLSLTKAKISEDELNKWCIMNEPEVTMSIPLLHEKELLKNVDSVLEVCDIAPGPRFKPLSAVVRGQGGGKTRALVTLQRDLLKKEEVLALAMTYNSYWSAGDAMFDTWDRKFPDLTPEQFYALSLTSRLLSMYHETELFYIEQEMIAHLHCLPDKWMSTELIQACVVYMVDRLSIQRLESGRAPISKCALLMDEVLLFENFMAKKFLPRDYTSIARSALLNKPINSILMQKPINVSLVMSSLQASAIGATSSSRAIRPIALPAKLNTKEIVSCIWEKTDHVVQYELIAEVLNNLPRLVQFAKEFLVNNATAQLDSVFVQNLFSEVDYRIAEMYSPQFPAFDLLYHILYGDAMLLEARGVTKAIEESMITNSLQRFKKSNSLIPEASLMMIYAASKDDIKAEPIRTGIGKIMDAIGTQYNGHDKGKLLEDCFSEWLSIRLFLAIKGPRNITLRKLIGIPDCVGKVPQLDVNIQVLSHPGSPEEMAFKLKDKNVDKYVLFLESIKVDETRPIVFLKPKEGETWDFGVKVFIEHGNPFYIFLDNKSSNELKYVEKVQAGKTVEYEHRALESLHNKGNQYKKVKNMLGGKIDFFYIYVDTHDVRSSHIAGESCAVMGRKDTKNMMGPAFGLYQAARSLIKTEA